MLTSKAHIPAKSLHQYIAILNVAIFWDIAPCNHQLHAGFLLGCFLTLKIEVIHFSEMSAHIQTI
jgi:hypothetical protein